jgi:hypothetical protein
MLQQISHVNGVGNSFDGTYFAVVVSLLGLSQTDTHDKHTSCLFQQLLHIRDHHTHCEPIEKCYLHSTGRIFIVSILFSSISSGESF